MTRRLKLLTGLSTLTLVGALGVSGCGPTGEDASTADAPSAAEHDMSSHGSEGEGSEGEGAEGEGSEGGSSEGGSSEGEGEGAPGDADPTTDDVEFINRLGQVKGHLFAFYTLYQAGEIDMAMTHAKHPQSELYADLIPAFEARNLSGFSDELTALVTAAEAGGDISAAYDAVTAGIGANLPETSAGVRLMALSALARVAADEFEIGVEDDGSISNIHEYQDALGFLSAAQNLLSEIEAQSDEETAAIATANEQLELALAEFDGMTATTTGGNVSLLYAVAARIEIAALGVI